MCCEYIITALLVYKFLQNGYPKYFVPFLKPRRSVYDTSKSQDDGMLLEVQHFAPSVYVSLLRILASALLMMCQISGMISQMMYVWLLLSTLSERSSKLISLHKHIHPNSCFSGLLSMLLIPAMSQVNNYSFLLFLYGAPRICLLRDIKRYKNTIRIRIKTVLPDFLFRFVALQSQQKRIRNLKLKIQVSIFTWASYY